MYRPPPITHRVFAALCTALVLALGVIGADHRLHAYLHAVPAECGHDHGPLPALPEAHDESCAVELFAAGLSLPVDPTHVVVAPLPVSLLAGPLQAEACFPAAPHRLPPAHGPPQV